VRKRSSQERGFALVAVLMLVALVAALLAAHFLLTRADLSTTRSAMSATRGFYAAEAGLNLRAQRVRALFEGYRRPAGTAPDSTPGQLPCEPGHTGSGDFACESFELGGRSVRTFIEEDPSNPISMLIPPGEPYENLNAQEYRYTVSSLALGPEGLPEAILEMRFKSRLVPMFQFAAFYNKDLEIYPGPPMSLDGPVHTNGDLYTGAEDGLSITGQVTVSYAASGAGGELYNGRKYDDCCSSPDVRIWNGAEALPLPSGPARWHVSLAEQLPWNGWIRSHMNPLTVPPPEALDPVPGQVYWDEAELRLVLDLDAGSIEVRTPDDQRDDAASTALAGCPGSIGGRAAGHTSDLYNWREGTAIELLEVDVRAVLDCAEAHPVLFAGRGLDDVTHGGLVWSLGVVREDTPVGTPNNFGVRLRRGSRLAPSSGSPEISGLTVVTNQALYVLGDYNSAPGAWKPAAFLADSINVLSNDWNDAASDEDVAARRAAHTSIYAAFLAGTDSSGGVEQQPLAGNGNEVYNGGLENYPRLHEDWHDRTLTYRGSFVSLNRPRHAHGVWDVQSYVPPDRDWAYDTRFNDARNLPPLTPRFVYLTQELFVREFEY
jgi:hypothetical protein